MVESLLQFLSVANFQARQNSSRRSSGQHTGWTDSYVQKNGETDKCVAG